MEYLKCFSKSLKAFLVTKFFAYGQEAFLKFLINIYLWRISNDMSFLVLYNIIFEISHGLTYFPAGKISKEYDRFLPLRTGLVLHCVFLGLILFLKESIIQYVIPVAIIGGVAHGAYWSSDNLLKFDLTNSNNRLKFTAVHHILKQTAQALIPLIASILVVAKNGAVVISYAGVFVASLIFTVLSLISTFFISKQNHFSQNSYTPLKTALVLLRNNNIRVAGISIFLSYVSDILPILLGLVLFFSSGTELSVGSYQFITIVIAIAVNFFVGEYFSRRDYKKLLVYGGLINFSLIVILLFSQNFVSVLIYGILSSIFSVANNPFYPLVQDSLGAYANDKQQLIDIRVEFTTIIEMFVVSGKIVGLLILLLIYFDPGFKAIAVSVVIFAFTRLLANIYISTIKIGSSVAIDSLN